MQTARRWISHTATMDETIIEPILAENYSHQVAPASIQEVSPQGVGPFDKQGFIGMVTGMKAIIKAYPFKINEIIESESSNAVVAYVTGEATFQDHIKDDSIPADEWKHTGNYIFWFYMDESSEKIVRTIEFLDSKATADKMMAFVHKASVNLAKRET